MSLLIETGQLLLLMVKKQLMTNRQEELSILKLACLMLDKSMLGSRQPCCYNMNHSVHYPLHVPMDVLSTISMTSNSGDGTDGSDIGI